MSYIFQNKNIARISAKQNNEIFYNRGIPCKKGHMSLRYVKTDKCIQCMKNAKTNYKKNNTDKVKINRKKYHLKELYSITLEQYNAMLLIQNSKCAICKKEETSIHHKNNKIKKLSVDHCHETGKIRGLLCESCNQGIGKFKHNSNWLRQAALYCEVV